MKRFALCVFGAGQAGTVFAIKMSEFKLKRGGGGERARNVLEDLTQN